VAVGARSRVTLVVWKVRSRVVAVVVGEVAVIVKIRVRGGGDSWRAREMCRQVDLFYL